MNIRNHSLVRTGATPSVSLAAARVLPALFACAFLFTLSRPAVSRASHAGQTFGVEDCQNCHSLDQNEGEDGTAYISSASRTLPTMKSLNPPLYDAPESFGCTYCHKDIGLNNIRMKGVLSHFGSKTSKHPVGYDRSTGNTQNEFMTTWDTNFSGELDCIDCHDPLLLVDQSAENLALRAPYANHVTPNTGGRVGNPFMLREAAVTDLCRGCHGAAPAAWWTGRGKANPPALADHDETALAENDGTPLQTSDCADCHDTHYSSKYKLFNDGHEGDTEILMGDDAECATVCHYRGDSDGNYDSHGHGMATSTSGGTLNFGCGSCHNVNTRHDSSNAKMLNFSEEGTTSTYGKSRRSLCYICHGGYDAHTGGAVEVGCLDCHDEHAENSGPAGSANIYMIPTELPNNYENPPGTPDTDTILFRDDGSVAGDYHYFNDPGVPDTDGTGLCDNAVCHQGLTAPDAVTPLNPLNTLMTGDAHSGNDQLPNSDCSTCHTHGDSNGSWGAGGGGASVAMNPMAEGFDLAKNLEIASLEHNAVATAGFSDRLVKGDVMTVTMAAEEGSEATFDVARLADDQGRIHLAWKGWGVYLEEITFFEEDQVDLRDVEEYRVYLGTSPLGEITVDTPFVENLDVMEQSTALEGLEPDTPYYAAVMALMEDGTFRPLIRPKQGLPMTEAEGSPGVYEGTVTVDYGDLYPEAVVVGHVARGEASGTLAGDEVFEIDARLTVDVTTSPSELEADETSTSEVKVTVTDANGDPVPDHEIRFLLATTSRYTGVVGGGAFTSEVGGALERDFRGETNMFGQVTATYTAGFAAKTAIIVARDMTGSATGAGYVKTYIDATAELELEAVQEVAGKALGYAITVTSSDEWLTADGESEARITALVTRNGIPVEGHRVGFTITSGAGSIRTVRGETGKDGKARAVYRAGTRIGTVLIQAADHTVGITGSVRIELRSDAPAKIALTVTPDRLPADGRSSADVLVLVTDINDNPNEGVEVEYDLAVGGGELRDIDGRTDRDGTSTATYVAGRLPGKVTIEVTVRSAVPTEEELAAARELAVSVPDYDFF